MFVGVAFLTGCSLQEKIDEYANDKEQCSLNHEDITKVSCQNEEYVILEDKATKDEVGEWIGVIRQFAVVDENGVIVAQEKMELPLMNTFERIKEEGENEAYVIPFLNVYSSLTSEDVRMIEINDEYYKAVKASSKKASDEVFVFEKARYRLNDGFVINPENATQLLYGDDVYQVTSNVVENEELGKYIDVLAKRVVFDRKTKRPLSKEELQKIDWYGDQNQEREQWVYTKIYEINGRDQSEEIAVEINGVYYSAKKVTN